MSEQAPPAAPDASPAGGELRERIFLVVVDETEEMKAALRFACRRALHTGGRVALFYAIEPPEFQHWQGVERMMQEEARQHAEEMLQALAAKVQADTGKMPILYLREGRRRDELRPDRRGTRDLAPGARDGQRPRRSRTAGQLPGEPGHAHPPAPHPGAGRARRGRDRRRDVSRRRRRRSGGHTASAARPAAPLTDGPAMLSLNQGLPTS